MATPEQLVVAFFRAYNERDVEGMRAVMAPDFRAVRGPFVFDADTYLGRFFPWEWANYPDARTDVHQITVAGNRVFVEADWSVTSTVPYTRPDGTRLPPTGKGATVPFVSIMEANGGLLTSDRYYMNNLDASTQLGRTVTIS